MVKETYPLLGLTEIKVTTARKYIRFKLQITIAPQTWVLFKGCIAGVGKDGKAWAMPSQTPNKITQHTVWSEALAQRLAKGLEDAGWFTKLLTSVSLDEEEEGVLVL